MCGACARYQRAHPEHRCSYSIHAVPSEPRPPPTPFQPEDYLPRFRSGSRALEALLKATEAASDGDPEQQKTEPASAEAPATLEEPSVDLTNRMASTSLSPSGPPGERRFELPPAIEQVGYQPRVFPTFPETLPATQSQSRLLQNSAHSDPRLPQDNTHSDPRAPPSHSHYHLPSTTSNLLPFVPPLSYPNASYFGASYSGDLQDAYDDPVAVEEEDASATGFETLASPAEPCVSPRDIVAGPSYSTTGNRFPPEQAFPSTAQPDEALTYPYPYPYPAPIPEECLQAADATAGPAYPRHFRLPDPFVPRNARAGSNIGPAPVEHFAGGPENFGEAATPMHSPGSHSWP
ncbi:hypothetical protein JCM8115_005448 [Rhodotorula mucilaginosa]